MAKQKPRIIRLDLGNGQLVSYVRLADVSQAERERWRAEHLELNQDDREAQEKAPTDSDVPTPVRPDRTEVPYAPPLPPIGADVEGNELPPEVAEALARGEFPDQPDRV